MICPRCSRQLPDGSKFCDACGLPMTNQAPASPQYIQAPGSSQTYTYPNSPIINQSNTPGKGMGVASLVLGIVSLIIACIPFFNLLPAIIGSVLGGAGMSQAKKVFQTNSLAVAGLVCSLVALSINVILILVIGSAIINELQRLDNFIEIFEILPYIVDDVF